MKINPLEIDGRTIEINVDDVKGTFHAIVESGQLAAPTLEQLRKKLIDHYRRAGLRLAVPAVLFKAHWDDEAPTLERITLTGVHSSSRNVLYKDSDGATHQSRSFSGEFLRDLTPPEIDGVMRLWRAKKAATAKFDETIQSYRLNAREAIEAAIAKAEAVPAKAKK